MRRLLLLFFLAISVLGFSEDDAGRVISEAQKPSPLETNLHRLTDEVGGRIPGTSAMQKAVDWGVEAFKGAGADRVRTENFTLPVSWAEGNTEVLVIGEDRSKKGSSVPVTQFRLRAVSIAWAPALSAHRHTCE